MNRLIVLVSVFGAACSSSTQPTQADYDDTAQQLGSTTSTGGGGGEVGSMADVVSLSTGTPVDGFTVDASGKITGTHVGLTYDYTLTCKDSGGNVLPVCTSLTNSADAMITWSGMLTLPNLTASVDRTGSWSVTGLQTATATFSGTGSFTFDATVMSIFRPVTAMYNLSADATYDSVLVATATKQPIGGDIHYDVTASASTTNTGNGDDSSAKFDISADVAFASNGTATLTLDGSHTYTIDTSTGVVVKVN